MISKIGNPKKVRNCVKIFVLMWKDNRKINTHTLIKEKKMQEINVRFKKSFKIPVG
jgi:hypothetical protein